jgi:hypothetical protein
MPKVSRGLVAGERRVTHSSARPLYLPGRGMSN